MLPDLQYQQRRSQNLSSLSLLWIRLAIRAKNLMSIFSRATTGRSETRQSYASIFLGESITGKRRRKIWSVKKKVRRELILNQTSKVMTADRDRTMPWLSTKDFSPKFMTRYTRMPCQIQDSAILTCPALVSHDLCWNNFNHLWLQVSSQLCCTRTQSNSLILVTSLYRKVKSKKQSTVMLFVSMTTSKKKVTTPPRTWTVCSLSKR